MVIVDTIKRLLDQQLTAEIIEEYAYQTPTRQNVELSKGFASPRCLFTCITDRTLSINKGVSRETAQVTLDYVTDSGNNTKAFDGSEMEEKINKMADAAIDLIARIKADKSLVFVGGDVQVTSLYDFMDRNCTGVRVQFSLRQAQGSCIMFRPVYHILTAGRTIIRTAGGARLKKQYEEGE